jgi:hypothetical protein
VLSQVSRISNPTRTTRLRAFQFLDIIFRHLQSNVWSSINIGTKQKWYTTRYYGSTFLKSLMSPFVNMPLYFLPKVMNQIRGNGKQSALYRLLKCIPDLCNVSERGTSGRPVNKRMKMSLFLTEWEDELDSKLSVRIRLYESRGLKELKVWLI